jgi:hypothetical protein
MVKGVNLSNSDIYKAFINEINLSPHYFNASLSKFPSFYNSSVKLFVECNIACELLSASELSLSFFLKLLMTLFIKSMKCLAFLIYPGITIYVIAPSGFFSIFDINLEYSSANRACISLVSFCIYASTALILLTASANIGLLSRTVYASIHTSSMLCASSNTTTVSLI